jgi:5-dehydro-4-deoxyglucarate dehydratase
MKPEELKARLKGVLAFAVTPFRDNHQLDLQGLTTNIDAMCRAGVHMIVCAGGVGEFYSLSEEEYRQLIRTCVRAALERVPVVAGIGHSTRLACELARFAEAEGIAGLMINPFYFVDPDLEGLYCHYEALARASTLGQIIFSSGHFTYTPELVERLAQIDNVVGLKDEVGDIKTFVATVERLKDRLAWINGMAEPLTAAYFACGATSFTTGMANFAPDIPLAIYKSAEARDYSTVQSLVARNVSPIARLRAKRKGYATAVLKEAMNLMGLPAGPCRLPLTPLLAEDRQQLKSILIALGLLEERTTKGSVLHGHT